MSRTRRANVRSQERRMLASQLRLAIHDGEKSLHQIYLENREAIDRSFLVREIFLGAATHNLQFNTQPLTKENAPRDIAWLEGNTLEEAMDSYYTAKEARKDVDQLGAVWPIPDDTPGLWQDIPDICALIAKMKVAVLGEIILEPMLLKFEESLKDSLGNIFTSRSGLASSPFGMKDQQAKTNSLSSLLPHTHDKSKKIDWALIIMWHGQNMGTLRMDKSDFATELFDGEERYLPIKPGPINALQVPVPSFIILPPNALHAGMKEKERMTRFMSRAFITPPWVMSYERMINDALNALTRFEAEQGWTSAEGMTELPAEHEPSVFGARATMD